MRTLRQTLLIAGILLATVGGAGINFGCSWAGSPTEPPIPLASVTGKVTHILTGVIVTSGTVTITPNGAPAVQVPISATGFYTAGALPIGPARIQASATGFAAYSVNVTLDTGTNTHDIRLVPNP